MRTLPSNIVSLLQQQSGLRPWKYVTVGNTSYGEDALADASVASPRVLTISAPEVASVQPRLLDIGGLDQTLGDGNGYSLGSISITLDDYDASLKDRFDSESSLEGTACTVTQVLNDANSSFTLFEGILVGPIVYDTSKKTLTFNIESYGASSRTEAGYVFSDSDSIRADLRGTTIPRAYGTVIRAKATNINNDLSTETKGNFSAQVGSVAVELVDFPVSPATIQVLVEDVLCSAEYENGTLTFDTINDEYYAGLGLATTAREGGDTDPYTIYLDTIESSLPGGTPYVPWIQNLFVKLDFDSGITSGAVVNYCVRQVGNKATFIKAWRHIGYDDATAIGSGETLNAARYVRTAWGVTYREEFATNGTDYYTADAIPDSFLYGPGAKVKLYTGETKHLIHETTGISGSPGHVLEVMAYRSNALGQRVLAPVPNSRFTVITDTVPAEGGDIAGMFIQLYAPLGSYVGEDWEDDLYVSFVSGRPGTPDKVIKDLVVTFSDLVVDSSTLATFAASPARRYPLGFVLRDKRDTMELVSDILRQVCSGYTVVGNKVFPRCLAYEPTNMPITLHNNIIASGSVNLGSKDLIDATTAYKGTYALNESSANATLPSEQKGLEYVYEANVTRFGRQEMVDSYWAHNEASLVKRCISWHGYRLSHSFVTLRCIGFLNLLPVEVHDVLNVSSELFSLDTDTDPQDNGTPIRFYVESASYSDNEVQLTGTVAALTGTEYAYDNQYFRGPSSNVYNYSGPIPNVGDGLSTIDYVPDVKEPNNKPGSRDRDGIVTREVVFETLPTIIKRGEEFTLVLRIKDARGRIIRADVEYPLSILGGHVDDTFNYTSAIFEDGTSTITGCLITGGTGDTSVQFKVITQEADAILLTEEASYTSASVTLNNRGSFRYTMLKAIERDTNFDLHVYGLLPLTQYMVILASDDGSELLKTVSPNAVLSTLTTDAFGEWMDNDLKFVDGTARLAGCTLTFQDPDNVTNVTDTHYVYEISGSGSPGTYNVVTVKLGPDCGQLIIGTGEFTIYGVLRVTQTPQVPETATPENDVVLPSGLGRAVLHTGEHIFVLNDAHSTIDTSIPEGASVLSSSTLVLNRPSGAPVTVYIFGI